MEEKRPSARRSLAADAEDRVWAAFYRNTRDPDLAAELIAHMDKNADVRTQYAGLYLRCKQSIRRHHERAARTERIAHIIRTALRLVTVLPARAVLFVLRSLGAAARFSGDIALSVCAPAAPAAKTTKVRKTRSSAPVANAPAAGNLTDAEADQPVAPTKAATPA